MSVRHFFVKLGGDPAPWSRSTPSQSSLTSITSIMLCLSHSFLLLSIWVSVPTLIGHPVSLTVLIESVSSTTGPFLSAESTIRPSYPGYQICPSFSPLPFLCTPIKVCMDQHSLSSGETLQHFIMSINCSCHNPNIRSLLSVSDCPLCASLSLSLFLYLQVSLFSCFDPPFPLEPYSTNRYNLKVIECNQ